MSQKLNGRCWNGKAQRRNQKAMKEFLWILAVRLVSVVMLMVRLFHEAGVILKMMSGFGQAGRKHPNGKFPFIHRESFVGLIHHRFRVLESLSANHIRERSIVGFGKRYYGKD